MATRKQDDQPSSNDQSGSTGRRTDKESLGRDKDTGQDRYGQSGLGGKVKRDTIGQKRYKESGDHAGPKTDSNEGSGNAADESEQHQKKPKANRP